MKKHKQMGDEQKKQLESEFEWFCDKNKGLLMHMAKGFAKTYPSYEDDFYALSLYATWKAFLNFDPNRGVTFIQYVTWLIRNEARMFMKKINRHQIVDLIDDYDFDYANTPESLIDRTNIENEVMDKLTCDYWWSQVKCLNKNQQAVVHLTYQGKMQDEIAKSLGKSVGSIKKHIKLARFNMKKMLEKPSHKKRIAKHQCRKEQKG